MTFGDALERMKAGQHVTRSDRLIFCLHFVCIFFKTAGNRQEQPYANTR